MTTQKRRPPAKTKLIAALGGALVFVSAGLYDFLGKWEGDMELVVYADKLAGGLPTVCRGLTRHVTKTPIVVGERWTVEKCVEEEGRAIEAVQDQLVKCFTRLPPQGVWDMATSHAWNNGVPNTCSSGVVRAFNAGRWEEGCRLIANHADGRPAWSYVRTGKTLPNGKPEYKFVQGLANRRNEERDRCLEAARP